VRGGAVLLPGDPWLPPQPGYSHDWDAHGGSAYLHQHLVENYVPCWQQALADGEWDAAVCDNAAVGPWLNYYVEGARWAASRAPHINGMYYDGISFDRNALMRVRRVVDAAAAAFAPVLDVHTGRDPSPPACSYAGMYPLMDQVWCVRAAAGATRGRRARTYPLRRAARRVVLRVVQSCDAIVYQVGVEYRTRWAHTKSCAGTARDSISLRGRATGSSVRASALCSSRCGFARHCARKPPLCARACTEISSQQHGLTGDMLDDSDAHAFKGMLYGMTYRNSAAASALWGFWDSARINETAAVGWWEDDSPVTVAPGTCPTSPDGVLATAYVAYGSHAVVVLASYCTSGTAAHATGISLDFDALGIAASGAVVTAPAIPHVQGASGPFNAAAIVVDLTTTGGIILTVTGAAM
jgi:hypothetical protein